MKDDMNLNQVAGVALTGSLTRLMVVDDDQGVLEIMALFLRTLSGIEVRCFQSAREALRAFTAAPGDYDFVVTDLEMPGMSGIEFCQQLHVLVPRIKVLLASGSGIITGSEAKQSGFCGLLPKPFPLPALLGALEAAGVINQRHVADQPALMPALATA